MEQKSEETLSLGALAPWRPSQSMILRSGSRDLQTHQGKSWPGMHRVWTRVDSVVPVKKLMQYHAVSGKKVDFGLPLCEIFHSSRFGSGGLSEFSTDATQKIWSDSVLSYFVRTWHTGLLLRSRVNAPSLDWSRFWRSRDKANTASCHISPKVDFGLPLCEIFHSSRFGSGGLSDFSTDTTQNVFGRISCSRTLSSTWHTGLDSCRS